jgi:hypothetical protein
VRVEGHAADIEAARKIPGHAVAMVRLREPLAQDGVVEALEARALQVLGREREGSATRRSSRTSRHIARSTETLARSRWRPSGLRFAPGWSASAR